MRWFFWLVVVATWASASPQVAFPFNSQVPPVARVGETYNFQLAATTFSSSDVSGLSYSLVDAPSWLDIVTSTRTLYGTPDQADAGPNTFQVVASGRDGSIAMSCTLVVASNNAPRLLGNISEDLARSGALSGPSTLLLQPSTAFAIAFSKDLFEAGRIQAYYGTMMDHSPLPSWLRFDSGSLTFSGITPVVPTGSQTYAVDLIGADVVGFAGVVVSFTLVVTNSQLTFNPQAENFTIQDGDFVSLGPFRKQLFLDGKGVPNIQLRNASAQLPEWLTFKNDSLELTGTPPRDLQSQSISIMVEDMNGATATKTIFLQAALSPLFRGHIDELDATAGNPFRYTIDRSIFSENDVDVKVDAGAASSWLTFDPVNLELHGTPPINAQPSDITVYLNASTPTNSGSLMFSISLKAAKTSQSSTSSQLRVAPTGTSTSSPSPTSSKAAGRKENNNVGIIVGIVIGCLAILALLVAIALLCCRRKRRQPKTRADKSTISKPISPTRNNEPFVSNDQGSHFDEEKFIGSPIKHAPEHPPQLDIDLLPSSPTPTAPRQMLRNGPGFQSKLSVVSSLGDGEATIWNDGNIPVWGRASGTTHTPHESYSAATELARRNSQASHLRLSAFRRLSPRKRASKVMVGLGLQTHGSVVHRPNRRSRMSSVFSIDREGSSIASVRTESIFSTKTPEFPEPPPDRNSTAMTEAAKRKSIRLVSRSGSVTDPRPISEKRQSYIRHRASGDRISSVLFASSRRSSNLGLYSRYGSLNDRTLSVRKPNASSSSIEPPVRNPRRLVSGAETFAPNYPRALSPAPVEDNSPILPVIPTTDDSDMYTTASSTQSSLHRNAIVAEEFAKQSALPRHSRNWVLPGEASPTPPPSSVVRPGSREATRLAWKNKLNRNSRGSLLSRSPSLSPVHLTGVSASGVRGRKAKLQNHHDEDKENQTHDRLSKLISHDSLSGTKHIRGRNRVVQVEDGSRISSSRARMEESGLPGRVSTDQDWEDVHSVEAREKGKPLVSSSSGIKVFI